MPYLSWWQALRVLAGREPGDAHIPSTDLPLQPTWFTEALAAGGATVLGLPGSGGVHEPIPPLAWLTITIHGSSSPRRFTSAASAIVGAMDNMPVARTWHDLKIAAEDVAKLRNRATDEPPPRTGAPGRPTSMHLIRQRLEELTGDGKSWPSKAAAAEELANWFKENHPNHPSPTASTIKNACRSQIPTVLAKPIARN